MRRAIAMLLAVLLLPMVGVAEDDHTFQYKGVCPHELCSFGTVLNDVSDAIGTIGAEGEFTSAVCEHCDQVYHITISGERANTECMAPDECAHQFRKLSYVLESGWYPVYNATVTYDGESYGGVSMQHEYRTYYLCVCDHCGTAVKMYEGSLVNGQHYGDHSYPDFEDLEIHYHDYERNQHVFVAQCGVCGHCTSVEQLCFVLDNGMCQHRLNEALGLNN